MSHIMSINCLIPKKNCLHVNFLTVLDTQWNSNNLLAVQFYSLDFRELGFL